MEPNKLDTADSLPVRLVGHKRDGTPQRRANQWPKRKELGGTGLDRDKDRHRAECAAAMLERHLDGKLDMSATQVQAAKILLDKGKPSLQAVEQTMLEPAMARTESEILDQLRAYIAQHPELIAELVGAQARDAGSAPVPIEVPKAA